MTLDLEGILKFERNYMNFGKIDQIMDESWQVSERLEECCIDMERMEEFIRYWKNFGWIDWILDDFW